MVGIAPPNNWRTVELENSITWKHPEEQQSFVHGQAFSPTCWHSHGNQGCFTICQLLHGFSQRNLLGSLYLGNPFLEEIHRWHLPDLPRHHQTTPVHEGFHEQPQPHNQIHFWTLHPREIFPRHEDPHRNRPQTLNNPVQKTQRLAHFCTSTPTTHNAKKALFSCRLLDTAKKNSTPLQYLSLPENTL